MDLLPHQYELTTRSERWAGLIGGYGSGKTTGGACAFFLLCLQNPGCEGLIVAPTYSMLVNVTLPAFERVASDFVVDSNKVEGWYRLCNGVKVGYASGDRPTSIEGRNVAIAWADEAPLLKQAVWRVLAGRLRSQAPRVQGILTGTPIAGTWVQSELDGGKPDRAMVRATSFDNPFVDPSWASSQLDTYSEQEARAYVYGQWTTRTGLIYPEFARDAHLVHGFTPDPKLPVIGGVDFGFRWPAVIYMQKLTKQLRIGERLLPAGSLVVFDEDLVENISTERLGQRIAQRYPADGALQVGRLYVDPAGSSHSNSASEHGGISDVEALRIGLRDNGLDPKVDWLAMKGNAHLRSIHTGLEQVRSMLRSARGDVRLYFDAKLATAHENSARGIVRAFEIYSWRRGQQLPQKGERAEQADHIQDALRYVVRHVELERTRKPMRAQRWV